MSKVLVPLTDGFEDIEAVTIIDILRRGGVEVVSASITGSLEVRSAHGIVMGADALIEDVVDDEYAAIVLPGGPGTGSLNGCGVLIERLRKQNADRGLIAAICAAPTVLTANEIIDSSLQITCYPTCVMDLDRPSVGVPVVSDGNVLTGQAPGSAMMFALVLLKDVAGPTVAGKVARGLVTDFNGGWR